MRAGCCVGGADVRQGRDGAGVAGIERGAHHLGDVEKSDASIEEGAHGDLVRRVEHGARAAARADHAVRERDRRKALEVDGLEALGSWK